MSEEVILDITTVEETVTIDTTDPEIIEINVVAPEGPAGPAGPNSITSTTTSDGTGNISLNTLEVLGTLTASHIHGNLAGSVYAHVRAGENLAKGDPVYVSGSHGSGSTLIAIVSKADASNASKMPAVGVMDAAVTANANGHMVITGTISDVNTAAYAINAELYVANGGGLTATPPAASSQPVGRVERSNTNNGAFIVKVNGWASSGGNGVSDANKLVRFDSSGTIPISSVTGSRSGIDSRTSFPNDAVTAATASATPSTLVLRDATNTTFFETIDAENVIALDAEFTGSITFNNGAFVYGAGAAAAHRTALGLTSLATTTAGTGVTTALAINVGLSGAFVVNGGALGTPSSGTLTNATGLPISTGVAGLGSGVATFLATPTSDNLAAALTDETGTSGGFVRAGEPTITSPTIAGSAQFTGTARPTSAATGSPAATSLITRADADTRFGGPLYTSFLANNTSYTNDATGTTILSVTLPAGTYQIEAFARFNANAVNSKITPAITGGASELWTGYRESYNNGSSPSRIAGANTASVSGGPWGATSNSENHARYGTLVITSQATYSIAAAQNTTSATTTTVSAGAYIIARKIA